MSNELWNLHCTHTTNEESDFDTVTQWAADYIVHLETQLAALKQHGDPVAWYNSREIGSFITFSKVEHDKWPNLYNVALYAAPQTCYSAGDMADAAAKAAQVEREECWRTAENHDTGAQAAKAIRMRGEETK